MNKIFIILKREFLNRVKKRSFLIATILVPMIFPAIIGVLIYASVQEEKHATKQVIHYIDQSKYFAPDSSKYIFKEFNGNLEDAKKVIKYDGSLGLLYIPHLNLFKPSGITLFTEASPSPRDMNNLEWMLEGRFKELKMQQLDINQKILDSLKTEINIENKLTGGKVEKSSDSDFLKGVGMVFGIFMYMFIFIYGAQIMQGIIEEKTSKVVEIIVSSVKPFQLMMGKILGLASVGLLQFTIWILVITTFSTLTLAYFGLQMPHEEMMKEVTQNTAQNQAGMEVVTKLSQIPYWHVLFCFLFYFVGGYLLYGALFAAVGASVDSPAEAQQFMFPITIPLFISYMSLFIFILEKPHSTLSVWLSIIPFTSPIAMMGRIAFDPPLWQEILSMVLLVAGFIFTTWIAGRIYRVGILMHGTKVNFKVLAKWFMMKG